MAGTAKLILAADTGQWDGSLKGAMKSLNSFIEATGNMGNALQQNSGQMTKFIDMMKNMETSAQTPKRAMRELTNAIGELQVKYSNLSDTDKNSQFGKAMLSTIDQLKQKAGQLKDQAADLNEELTHLASDTQFTDGLSMMTRTVGSCASAMVAWSGDGETMKQVIADLAKIQTTVAAVEALTKAFQKQNLVLLKNPYVLAAAAATALGYAIYKLVAQEDAEIKTNDGLVVSNQQVADSYNKQKTAVSNLIDYKIKLANLDASTARQGVADARVGFTEADKIYREAVKRRAAAAKALDEAIKRKNNYVNANKSEKNTQWYRGNIAKLDSGISSARSNYNTAKGNELAALSERNYRAKELGQKKFELANAHEVEAPSGGGSHGGGGSSHGSGGGGVVTTTVAEEVAPAEGSINAVKAKIDELEEAFNATAEQSVRDNLRKQIDDCNAQLEKMKGNVKDVALEMVEGPKAGSSNWLTAVGGLYDNSNTEIGSSEYQHNAGMQLDVTTFGNLTQAAADAGVSIDDALRESIQENLVDGIDIPDETWTNLVAQINEQLATLGIDPIKVDVKTGKVDNVVTTGKEVGKAWSQAANAISSVGGAIGNIDNKGVQLGVAIAQSIANIMMAYSETLAKDHTSKSNIWSFIAAAAAATVSMGVTIAQFKKASSGYAEGGILGGNSYAGDAIPFMGNAGEVVLNAGQQENLASALTSGGGQQSARTTISGEQLVTVINNYGRRTHKGEILR